MKNKDLFGDTIRKEIQRLKDWWKTYPKKFGTSTIQHLKKWWKPYTRKLATICTVTYILLCGFVGRCATGTTQHKPVSYVARQPFPANHRVVAVDLIVPDSVKDTPSENALPEQRSLTGKYLVHAVGVHDPISETDVAENPRIKLREGTAVIPITLSAELPPGLVDVGSRIDVVSNGKTIAQDIQVAAVSCRSACVALVSVPQNGSLANISDKNAVAILVGPRAPAPAVAVPPPTKGATVDSKTWQQLMTADVFTTPDGLWTKVIDYVAPGSLLKFEIAKSAMWTYATQHSRKCAADGDVGAPPDSGLLLPEAPVGAVIAKVGGSSAGKSDGPRFVVGAFAVITVGQDQSGPLYLTMNVNPVNRPTTNDKLAVSIFEAKR